MSIFSDNITSQIITERVFDFAWDEYTSGRPLSFTDTFNNTISCGRDLYNLLIRYNFNGNGDLYGWSYYITKGMMRLTTITGKHYTFHVERWPRGNGHLSGLTKAIVVTEV
jgi:hypothetical protein